VSGTARLPLHLVAYTNTQEFLVGPAGMSCSGTIGADGGASINVWAPGQGGLQKDADVGLSIGFIPACVGCQASAACPFFPGFAAHLGFPCTSGIPDGERVTKRQSNQVRYEDPAGVSADGFPSGGVNAALGVVGINRNYYGGTSVYLATCTLPERRQAVCTTSLYDAGRRYG
jgi:hypothetical protein